VGAWQAGMLGKGGVSTLTGRAERLWFGCNDGKVGDIGGSSRTAQAEGCGKVAAYTPGGYADGDSWGNGTVSADIAR